MIQFSRFHCRAKVIPELGVVSRKRVASLMPGQERFLFRSRLDGMTGSFHRGSSSGEGVCRQKVSRVKKVSTTERRSQAIMRRNPFWYALSS